MAAAPLLGGGDEALPAHPALGVDGRGASAGAARSGAGRGARGVGMGEHPVEEAGGLAGAAGARGAGRGPADGEQVAGAGEGDVEQSPLLLDLGRGLRHGDRQQPVARADHEHDRPLQALGGMDGGEGDAVDDGRGLRLGPLLELSDHVGHGRAGPSGDGVGEADEGVQRLPAVADRAGGVRGLLGPALLGEDVADGAGRVELLDAGRGAQGHHRAPHLLPFEEAVPAAHQVADPAGGERLLERLGLAVGAEQDRDLGGGAALGDQRADAVGDPVGLGGVVGEGLHQRRRPGIALGDEGETTGAGAALRAVEDGVGHANDLGGGAVVALEADGAGALELAAEVQEIGGTGAGEGVDRLGGIAHHAQVVGGAQPQPQQGVLQG